MSDPISITAVVRRTFDLYARQASLLLPAAVCLAGVVGVVGALSNKHSRGLSLLGLIVTVAALALFTGVVVQVVVEARDGPSNVSIRQVLRAVRPVLGCDRLAEYPEDEPDCYFCLWEGYGGLEDYGWLERTLAPHSKLAVQDRYIFTLDEINQIVPGTPNSRRRPE